METSPLQRILPLEAQVTKLEKHGCLLTVTELFQISIISVHSLCLIKAKGIESFLSSNSVNAAWHRHSN